jgi:hypothetical protein
VADDLLLDNGHVGAGSGRTAVHAVIHERSLHDAAAEELVHGSHRAHLALPCGVHEEVVVEHVIARSASVVAAI